MEIQIQSIKFDADQKLIDFANKKLSKLEKFYDEAALMEVNLSLLNDPQNKNVKIRVIVPGAEGMVVERKSETFESAIVDCSKTLKDMLVQAKEKRFQ